MCKAKGCDNEVKLLVLVVGCLGSAQVGEDKASHVPLVKSFRVDLVDDVATIYSSTRWRPFCVCQ